MPDTFVKFPRTPHLAWRGTTPPRGDKLLTPSEAETWLTRSVLVEEKVDGTGLGFSVSETGAVRAQNRGSYLVPDGHPQFRPLWPWLARHESALRTALGQRLILFGEWCYARHTVPYDALPDWFLAFDVYDRDAGRFWSRARRTELVRSLGVAEVPLLASGRFDQAGLDHLLGVSRVGSAPMEGLYLRWEEPSWLLARAKLVRASWLPHDEEHWSRRPLVRNRLESEERLPAAGGERA